MEYKKMKALNRQKKEKENIKVNNTIEEQKHFQKQHRIH